ncbi:MAG: YkvA family protein [Cyanobacteria bacterium J06648_16]
MKDFAESFYSWYRNTLRNTKYRWLIVLGTVLYLVSPFDIAPDFIPVIGWIDDGIIATLLIAELSQIATEFLANRNKQTEPIADDTVIDV